MPTPSTLRRTALKASSASKFLLIKGVELPSRRWAHSDTAIPNRDPSDSGTPGESVEQPSAEGHIARRLGWRAVATPRWGFNAERVLESFALALVLAD